MSAANSSVVVTNKQGSTQSPTINVSDRLRDLRLKVMPIKFATLIYKYVNKQSNSGRSFMKSSFPLAQQRNIQCIENDRFVTELM